jgi:hypothetical protein
MLLAPCLKVIVRLPHQVTASPRDIGNADSYRPNATRLTASHGSNTCSGIRIRAPTHPVSPVLLMVVSLRTLAPAPAGIVFVGPSSAGGRARQLGPGQARW